MSLRCKDKRLTHTLSQAWEHGGYSDDLIVAAQCKRHGLQILCPALSLFPQWCASVLLVILVTFLSPSSTFISSALSSLLPDLQLVMSCTPCYACSSCLCQHTSKVSLQSAQNMDHGYAFMCAAASPPTSLRQTFCTGCCKHVHTQAPTKTTALTTASEWVNLLIRCSQPAQGVTLSKW